VKKHGAAVFALDEANAPVFEEPSDHPLCHGHPSVKGTLPSSLAVIPCITGMERGEGQASPLASVPATDPDD
jgi:hypothetical protein